MTIYIDALGLVCNHFSGVGRYILGILRGLDELLEQAARNGEPMPRIEALIPFDRRKAFADYKFRHLKPRIVPLPFALLEPLIMSWRWPILDLICGKGVYIFTRFVCPRLWSSPSAVVVYDLSFELHKEFAPDGLPQLLSEGVKSSLEQSERVITISDNARREILGFYGVDPKQVVVATPAADQEKFYRRSAAEVTRVKARYGIEGEYILALSNLEPRKNLGTLVDVYCELPEAIRERFGLLLVGAFGWKFHDTMEKILDRIEQGHNIIRPSGYVTDEDTPALLSGASVLVYPSHYEGFGMPPLEALACGTPVVVADNSSLPQVVGQAGRLVPSDQPQAIRRAIEDLFQDLPAETAAASVQGPAQAARFNWTTSARVFLDVAKELAQKSC